MTDSDALLHETNRAAHKVAKAAREYEKATHTERSYAAFWKLQRANREYEEAERRAQREATA